MHNPSIDLTAAAQAYGLDYVPRIIWSTDLNETGGMASFLDRDRTIYVDPRGLASSHLTDAYDQARFARQGVGPLDRDDAARFILAHELWHAAQGVGLDPRVSKAESDRESMMMNLAAMFGDPRASELHDSAPVEVQADRAAARVYKLVKIDGR